MKAPVTSVNFPSTAWTAIQSLREDCDQAQTGRVLSALCAAYWPPLYAFARRSGRRREDAEDATQSFLAAAATGGLFAAADQEVGKLRTFLLSAFTRHLRDIHDRATAEKRGGQMAMQPLDFESVEFQFAKELGAQRTPDRTFDRVWTRMILERTLDALGALESSAGRDAPFAILKDHIIGEGDDTQGHREIAQALGTTPAAARQALSRLRSRFRDILRSEIAATLCEPDPADIDAELASLRASLRQ